MTETSAPEPTPAPTVSRRGLLFGGGIGLGVGAVLGAVGASAVRTTPAPDAPPAGSSTVSAHGAHQAGVDRPATPQRNALVVVADLAEDPTADTVRAALVALGDAVAAVTDPVTADPLVAPDGPGDLTVTIGLGPRMVSALGPGLPGATGLPRFASDAPLDPALSGGDLLVAASATDAAVLHGAVASVLGAVPHATRRWAQPGVRGAGEGTIVRNPLGYHDGIIVPHGDTELAESVWIGEGPAAGGTIAVIRRLRLDVARFHGETPERQDAVIGRRRRDGAPLSGGGLHDQVDLTAKTPEGQYLVPARAHARAAHPSFTGSPLMLRRGYAYSNAVGPGEEADDGLLFVCFQNDIDTFVRTQHRLDETDDLMGYATVTASASFLIVPGAVDGRPLGEGLRRGTATA